MDPSRSAPDWLREGASVWDRDDERWVIRSIGPSTVAVGHPERGEHELRRSDLVSWVERGDWDATG